MFKEMTMLTIYSNVNKKIISKNLDNQTRSELEKATHWWYHGMDLLVIYMLSTFHIERSANADSIGIFSGNKQNCARLTNYPQKIFMFLVSAVP